MIALQGLVDIVEGYRSRTYNEDMVKLENLGGISESLMFHLIGVQGICEKTRSNIDQGLTPVDFPQREQWFGSNAKNPPALTPFYKLFLGALDDFMLKFLLVCAIVDLSIEVGFAEGDEKNTGKCYLSHNGHHIELQNKLIIRLLESITFIWYSSSYLKILK